MEVEMLVVGNPEGNASFVAARRCDANRTAVDPVVLPSDLQLQPGSSDLPQHPLILLRTFDNVQILMDPYYLRMIGGWILDSADWLEGTIERGE